MGSPGSRHQERLDGSRCAASRGGVPDSAANAEKRGRPSDVPLAPDKIKPPPSLEQRPAATFGTAIVDGIDKSRLAHSEPRRFRDKVHVRFVAKQPCLICGRRPSDPHHLRFAQRRALGRKVSDEFTVPLCRGHHREVHRSGDEASWWSKAGIDPIGAARTLWTETHPLWSVAEASNPDQSIASRVTTSDLTPVRQLRDVVAAVHESAFDAVDGSSTGT